jgi:hypothetical protein
MSNEHNNVISISSRPQLRDRSGDYTPTRRRPGAKAGAAALAAVVVLGAGAVYKGDQNFKHEQSMDVLNKVEKDSPVIGDTDTFVIHAGATLRRTPNIPGRDSVNHQDGGEADSTKDNVERIVDGGKAIIARGAITTEGSDGNTWYGVEIVENINQVEAQSRGDLGDNVRWFSSELFDQHTKDGQPYVEVYNAGDQATLHFEGGHYVDAHNQAFAVAQEMDAQAAVQLASQPPQSQKS